MKLTEQEIFALTKVFSQHAEIGLKILANLDNADVVERDSSEAGFFSTINFHNDVLGSTQSNVWEWNFNHSVAQQGGSFIVYKDSPQQITLEATTFADPWPLNFNAQDYSDL